MLKLIDRELPHHAVDALKDLQKEIDILPEKERAAKAKALWEGRTNNEAFETIHRTLKGMCVGKAKCNYCEHNEAADIEHIAPKSLFPELAFVWTNYILACKQCNTGHKLDKMYVFSPPGSATSFLAKAAADGSLPESKDLAYIHPRFEDPMDLMQLNMWEDGDLGDFIFYPLHSRDTREHAKVANTLEILKLDEARSLDYDRAKTFNSFKASLAEYARVVKASTHEDLTAATRGYPPIDRQQPIEVEKNKILASITKDIEESIHPTVWREMIRQRTTLPQPMQEDFEAAKALWQQL